MNIIEQPQSLASLLVTLALIALVTLFPSISQELDQMSEQVLGASVQENYPNETKYAANGFPTEGIVARVIDGDTIELSSGEKIRYIGIDTPETKHPQKGVECYGKQASARNQALVLGKKVNLVKDVSTTDRYQRYLAYVYQDEHFINQILVEEGYAFSSPFPPDIAQQELLDQAQQRAEESSLGLWGACQL